MESRNRPDSPLRSRRKRRAAREIVSIFIEELIARKCDPDRRVKLLTLESLAFRMGWHDLYKRLRFENHGVATEEREIKTDGDDGLKWFQR